MSAKKQLNIDELKNIFIYVSKEMVNSKDILTQADKAIGDGDHGIGMARGFEAVIEKLTDQSFDSVGSLLNNIGMALLTSVGGAAGAIFGTFFRGSSNNLKNITIIDGKNLALMLEDGLEAVEPCPIFPRQHDARHLDCPRRCSCESPRANERLHASRLFSPRLNFRHNLFAAQRPACIGVVQSALDHAGKSQFAKNLVVRTVVRLPGDDFGHRFFRRSHHVSLRNLPKQLYSQITRNPERTNDYSTPAVLQLKGG